MFRKDTARPRANADEQIKKETFENLFKTKRRKTIATNESAI